jgi:myo-inositol-1(or 4)-monophosphatase
MREEMLSTETLRAIAEQASDLARLAGAEIVGGLGKLLAIRYKGERQALQEWRDPVSEVDGHIEQMIRQRLAEKFPDHDVLGEESDERPRRGAAFIWAIDPIDGTTNFINGFPFFSASIGVLHKGRPIVGALWCSATHALRPGVYHAHAGGRLHFDGEVLERTHNPEIKRRLSAVPGAGWDDGLPWESRKTGSAAVECAFVAARLLRVARFALPNVWDVAGGVTLVQAAGGEVRTKGASGWEPFNRFEARGEGSAADIRLWRQPLVLGEREAVTEWCGLLDRAGR